MEHKPDTPLTSDLYFPLGVFANKMYSPYLIAMNEPSLCGLDWSNTEIYRFLWLRTFHAPIAIRAQYSNDECSMWVKQLSGKGGYEPGEIVVNRRKRLSRSKWARIIRYVEQANFWTLARIKLESAKDALQHLGLDGAMWIVEGVKDGQYHYVDRWCPSPGGFRDCCLYMLELSKLKVDRVY